ncbi:MAG: hypothetical protein ACOC8F_05250 [Planctomycetota bacterium]
MSPPPHTRAAEPGDPERLLDEIEALLGRQLYLARAGRYAELSELDADLRRCTERLTASGDAPADRTPQVRRVAALYHALELALIQRRDELGSRIDHLRRGRGGLIAYAAAAGK